MEDIREIHERLYDYLSKRYEKDNDLRFTLRSTNHGSKLNLGYWFQGSQNHLEISFWEKTSTVFSNGWIHISFVIADDGSSSLELEADNGKKLSFLLKIADALDMKEKNQDRDYYWIKNYKGTDYIASVEIFLKRDKIIIDSLILTNNMTKSFQTIPQQDFLKAKYRIDTIRKNHHADRTSIEDEASINTKPIKIQELTIKNISLFKSEQTIEFHKNLTCFIGLNGTGKTSLLKALVLAFTGFEQNEELGTDKIGLLREKLQNLLHVIGEKNGRPIYAKSGFTEVAYTMQTNGNTPDEFKNRVSLRKTEYEMIISDDSNSDFKNILDDKYKCLFIAIPQLHGEVKLNLKEDRRILSPNINDAISMLSGHPKNSFNMFTDWLRGLNDLANYKQANEEVNPVERVLLSDIFKAISKITGEEVTLHNIFVTGDADEPDPIWVNIGKSTEPILLDLVSQGYNSVFSFIGNILQRLVEVTPKGGDYKQTWAIVLIDEIDTYLHPQWQYTILDYLVETFPNVQFIVTTHSPYVVGSIPNDKIKIYICEKEGFEAKIEAFDNSKGLYGANIERLTRVVFRTSARGVPNLEKTITELRESIQLGQFDKAENILSELDKQNLVANDPELLSIKLLLKTKKRLATA